MVKPAGSRPQEVIERSGRAGPGRSLDQIVSVRFHPPLLRAARLHAESKGITLSDVIRLALTDYLEENSAAPPCLAREMSAWQAGRAARAAGRRRRQAGDTT